MIPFMTLHFMGSLKDGRKSPTQRPADGANLLHTPSDGPKVQPSAPCTIHLHHLHLPYPGLQPITPLFVALHAVVQPLVRISNSHIAAASPAKGSSSTLSAWSVSHLHFSNKVLPFSPQPPLPSRYSKQETQTSEMVLRKSKTNINQQPSAALH